MASHKRAKQTKFVQAVFITLATAIFVYVYKAQPQAQPPLQLKETERSNRKQSIIDALKQKAESDLATIESLRSEIESIQAANKDVPKVAPAYLTDGKVIFLETAMSHDPVTDKVTTHEYNIMYGKNLLPYYQKHPKMKMLEIGLGCDMKYGPGASVKLWKELLPEAELWEAEYYGDCVKKNKEKGQLEGVNTLVGDQSDPKVLDEWIEKSGGDFDVIIDDGGHGNCQIWTSFEKLWPTVKRGGLYFIEDLHASKRPGAQASTPTCDGSNLNVPDKLKDILERLMYEDNKKKRVHFGEKKTGDFEFLFCQPEACVLQKKD